MTQKEIVSQHIADIQNHLKLASNKLLHLTRVSRCIILTITESGFKTMMKDENDLV